jgi:hypothetical protein
MGYLRTAAFTTSGTANGLATGSDIAGTAILMGSASRRVDHLSSIVAVTAVTTGLTLTHKWQASNDATTWFDLAHEPQNPAGVVLATGVGTGARGVSAPAAINGFRHVRAALAVAGATGVAGDTYSLGYAFRKLDPVEALDGHLRFSAHVLTGTATGVAPGGQVNGNALFMGGRDQKVEALSALVTCDAETNTITLAARWQGSDDKSTWHTLALAPQNPAAVVLATGTAGSDADVTKVVPAPDSVYSYRFARCSLVVGAVTGTNDDTYSIAYNYRQADPGGRQDR